MAKKWRGKRMTLASLLILNLPSVVYMALALACVLLSLSTLLATAMRSIRNRRLGRDPKPRLRGAGVAQAIIMTVCVLNLLFLTDTALWGWPGSELLSILPIYQLVLGLGVLSGVDGSSPPALERKV